MSTAQGINDYDGLTLATIGCGALEEKFQVELNRVLENIEDLNTEGGKRTITLKLTFKPNAKRTSADISLQATSSLAADIPIETNAYLGKEGAVPMAWEHNPEQLRLPMEKGSIAEVHKKTIGGINQC